jgi:hypothetical protein|tara:strand:- start:220 stop:396 length:177 start_codon:yes stop_codon:yes gene_type:complete
MMSALIRVVTPPPRVHRVHRVHRVRRVRRVATVAQSPRDHASLGRRIVIIVVVIIVDR